MSRFLNFTAAACALALVGCAPEKGSDAAEAERLMQTSREWSKVAASGDMDKVLVYFADDAVMISAGRPPVRGRDALRSFLSETSKIPGFRISWEPLEAEVSGDIGYMLERTQMTMTGPDGAPVTQQLQAVTIWRKQPDGSWKNVVDASVPAEPERPQTAG